jgi:hypothetical protein
VRTGGGVRESGFIVLACSLTSEPTAEQALQILAGDKPQHSYNPDVWERARSRRR